MVILGTGVRRIHLIRRPLLLFQGQTPPCQVYGAIRLLSTVKEKETQTQLKSEVRREAYPVVIVGGGAGGLSVAAQLRKVLGRHRVAIVEPRQVCVKQCFYQISYPFSSRVLHQTLQPYRRIISINLCGPLSALG